jgi:hypothetical protein
MWINIRKYRPIVSLCSASNIFEKLIFEIQEESKYDAMC